MQHRLRHCLRLLLAASVALAVLSVPGGAPRADLEADAGPEDAGTPDAGDAAVPDDGGPLDAAGFDAARRFRPPRPPPSEPLFPRP